MSYIPDYYHQTTPPCELKSVVMGRLASKKREKKTTAETKITWTTITNACELCKSTVNLKKVKDNCGVLVCRKCWYRAGTPISNALHARAYYLNDDELSELIDKKQL